MGISPRQIGWSNESNLLWQLSKQLDKLTGVTATNLSAIIADLATKVTNQQGVPSFRADTLANLPVAGQTGRMFVATDTYAFYRDNGLGWDLIGGPGIGTVTGSGTATQVAFWNGTSVISGSNNLFWDNANSRLGIGTSSPTALLDVRGTGVSTDFRLSRNIDPNIYLSINAPGNTPNRSTFGINGTNVMTLNASGNVGIGTTTPQSRIHALLSGNAAAGPTGTVAVFQNSTTANNSYITLLGAFDSESGIVFTDESVAFRGKIGYNNSTEFMYFQTDGSERMRITSNGNVGVGIVPTAYLGFVSSAAGISLHTNSTSGAAGLNFYENSSGRFSLRTLNGTAGLSFFDSFNGAERARIDASGNLGLGTSSPQTQLDIANGLMFGTIDAFPSATYDAAAVIAKTGSLGSAPFNNAGSIVYRARVTSTAGRSSHIFYTGSPSTERMRLNESGNLGIGTATPQSILDITAPTPIMTISATTTTVLHGIEWKSGTSLDAFIKQQPNTGEFRISNGRSAVWGGIITFYTDISERMRITSVGNVGIGTTSPTYKLEVSNNSELTGLIAGVGTSTTQNNGGAILAIRNTNNTNGNMESLLFQNSAGTGVAAIIAYNTNHATGEGLMTFGTRNSTGTFGERMRLDASGNLGLGVTPSAWGISNTSIEIGNTLSLFRGGSAQTILGFNTYINASSQFIYKISSFASYYQQISGVHSWHTAPSGTAGNAITFTQAMTLDASGRLGIGATSLFAKLQINASGVGIVDNTILENTNAAAANLGSALTFAGVGTVAQTVIRGAWDGSATTDAYMSFLTRGSNSVQERMRITSGGGIGINGTSPSGSLDIYGNTGTKVRIGYFTDQGTDDPTLRMFDGKLTRPSYSFTSDNTSGMFGGLGFVAFSTSASERMRITSGGELLINTTSDAGDYKLQVNGNSYFNGNLELSGVSAGTRYFILTNNATYTGNLVMQAGAGSSGFGGGLILYGHSHASFPGWVKAGISNGSSGKFSVNTQGLGGGTDVFTVDVSGNSVQNGSIKTAAPSGGTAKPWKLGTVKTDTVVLDDGAWVEVEIDGVAYKLALAVIP